MDLIRAAITRPIAVISVVLMVLMFGVLGLLRIPIQLAPDVRQPVITVSTNWPGASPAEVEREVVSRQEEFLKGLEGLRSMSSRARRDRGQVTLEFSVDQNMDRAMLLVSNRLSQISGYPDDVREPTLSTSGTDDNPIAWLAVTRAPGVETPIDQFGDLMEDVVRDRIERVPGVAEMSYFGGSSREMRIVVDPDRMALYGLTVPDVVDALRAADVSLTAGDVNEGKRLYTVRVEGQLSVPEQVAALPIRSEGRAGGSEGLARVTVGDIAEVSFAYKTRRSLIRYMGEPSISLRVISEAGSNVIEVMEGLNEELALLEETVFAENGLRLHRIYDETVYVTSAIDLVVQNIYIGGFLAAVILVIFLRRAGPTLVISLAIPVSIIGAFVGMAALGRSLNVISLAGIAFAVGMVVDAAIVVLENIYRLREQGYSRFEAAYHGAKQVWGAILVSALTTVLVFVPILILNIEIGQLFRDIAVAISVAVTLSLVVAITVIPALARRLLGGIERGGAKPFTIPVLDPLAAGFANAIGTLSRKVIENRGLALAIVSGVTVAAGVATVTLLPKLEYLPEGNRNLIFGGITPPPGYNLATTTDIVASVEAAVRPLWVTETGPDPAEDGTPKIAHFFSVAQEGSAFFGVTSVDEQRAGALIAPMRAPLFREPGTFGFITQPSLFGRSVGGARAIDLNISGPDLETILEVARRASVLVDEAMPRDQGHQMRPQPGLELGAPEVRVYPDTVSLKDAGVSVRAFAQSVDAFNGGLRVSEITVGNSRMDLTLTGPDSTVSRTQSIETLPIVTAEGRIVPVSSLGRIEVTAGPTEIRRYERQRTVTLQVRPDSLMPLETAMEILQTQVIEVMQEEGLPPGITLRQSGTADKLTEAWAAMLWLLVLAVAIVYLVMAILFESFIYPLVILFTVPLASAGAVLGLGVFNLFTYQPLDMLTLLGFVILIGVVVNNAILLVHQTLHNVRNEGMAIAMAIETATRNRVRPIFMSTLTSLFGMLPLVLFPGAGSELYRGLGAVVLGGLALSAVLTLVIIPPLMSLVVGIGEARRTANAGKRARRRARHRLRGGAAPQGAGE